MHFPVKGLHSCRFLLFCKIAKPPPLTIKIAPINMLLYILVEVDGKIWPSVGGVANWLTGIG